MQFFIYENYNSLSSLNKGAMDYEWYVTYGKWRFDGSYLKWNFSSPQRVIWNGVSWIPRGVIWNSAHNIHNKNGGGCCGCLCLKYYRAPRYRMRCVIIVLVERRCAGCTNKWSSLLENNVYLQRLNGNTTCAVCSIAELRTCWFYEYKTVTALPVAALTGAENAYTKRDIENSFPGTQMFVQARNYECPQQQSSVLCSFDCGTSSSITGKKSKATLLWNPHPTSTTMARDRSLRLGVSRNLRLFAMQRFGISRTSGFFETKRHVTTSWPVPRSTEVATWTSPHLGITLPPLNWAWHRLTRACCRASGGASVINNTHNTFESVPPILPDVSCHSTPRFASPWEDRCCLSSTARASGLEQQLAVASSPPPALARTTPSPKKIR